MKKLIVLLLTLCIALGSSAANKTKKIDKNRKRSNIVYYTVANAPEAMEIPLRNGDSITFHLEENPTTGYVWEANYDSRRCRVDLKQRASKAKRVGAPGLVEVKIKLNTSRDAVVELAYRRPFEKDKKHLKVIRCHVFNRYDNGETDTHRKDRKKPDDKTVTSDGKGGKGKNKKK